VDVTPTPRQATRQTHPERTLLVLATDFPGAPEAVEGYVVQAAESWAELAERVRTAAPSTIVMVRVEAGADAAELRGLMRATPSVPVVAAVSFRQAGAAQVGALLAAGIAEIVNLDMLPVLAGMVPTLRRAHARPLKRRLEVGLPVWVPEEARTLLRAAAETVADRGGRPRFAEIFGVYVRTVAIKSRELNLPPPRRLLAWVRVLLALSLLEEEERTVINVAHVCGYRDNSSLKRAIENFTGTPALASIRDQSFAAAFDRFAGELRDLRLGTHGRAAAPRA
jgi:AraC-like DNA-binding protein